LCLSRSHSLSRLASTPRPEQARQARGLSAESLPLSPLGRYRPSRSFPLAITLTEHRSFPQRSSLAFPAFLRFQTSLSIILSSDIIILLPWRSTAFREKTSTSEGWSLLLVFLRTPRHPCPTVSAYANQNLPTSSSLFSLRNKAALSRANITHVVSVLRMRPEESLFEPFSHLVIDVDDVEDENLLEHFATANAFIQSGLDAGGSVLVHWSVHPHSAASSPAVRMDLVHVSRGDLTWISKFLLASGNLKDKRKTLYSGGIVTGQQAAGRNDPRHCHVTSASLLDDPGSLPSHVL
jgi:hypothetical protein